MKVLMFPSPDDVNEIHPSGIQSVIANYDKHFPDYDIEIVNNRASSFDLIAIHAGVSTPPERGPFVSHCHGLYWTADYAAEQWEYEGNSQVINNLRIADEITVPSEWVAQNIARGLRIVPNVVYHGVDSKLWSPIETQRQFVLWNKNRLTDVCSSEPLSVLAEMRPSVLFASTLMSSRPTPNVMVTGVLRSSDMANVVRSCAVYLATVKETFGVGTLEAMASGKPILGFDYGGTSILVKHGVNGYLARPGDYVDLANGLDYCFANASVLGENSRQIALEYSWDNAVTAVARVYKRAISKFESPHDVSVVIPCYNKARTLLRAARSVAAQKRKPVEVILVNNNSTDDFDGAATEAARVLVDAGIAVRKLNEPNQGVAHARNAGIELCQTRYICCLDADDEIHEDFLITCVTALKRDPSLGVAYAKLEAVYADESGSEVSAWPDEYNFDRFIKRQNQVPTCAVFRRDLWSRLGGYRQRYAPEGAGAEDAEFWLRMGALGYPGKLASSRPLFKYHLGGLVTGNSEYRETDWLAWHPWAHDGKHPFASAASPANGMAHDVQQYDEPVVSVIIPCTPEHTKFLMDALDSVEAQTYRKWEVIVVFDGQTPEYDKFFEAYPFISFYSLPNKVGSGAARNFGASKAKSDLLLFLDADDWLEPTCIEKMLIAYQANPGEIIYSDYLGRAYGVTDPDLYQRNNRLVYYDETDQYAIIRYSALDYDCATAVRQPELDSSGEFYIWNLISSLTPKRLHDAIGGFDESMSSWEDWDYWLRMARAGFCFERVAEPLISYRFYTGTRREIGRQQARKLLDYLTGKYSGEKPMCGSCRKPKKPSPVAQQLASVPSGVQMSQFTADGVVRVRLLENGFGKPIRIRDRETNQIHDYGYRKGGDTFLMLRKHADMFPNRFGILADTPTEIGVEPESEPKEPTPPPTPITNSPSAFSIDDDDDAIGEPDQAIEPPADEIQAESSNEPEGLPEPKSEKPVTKPVKRTTRKRRGSQSAGNL